MPTVPDYLSAPTSGKNTVSVHITKIPLDFLPPDEAMNVMMGTDVLFQVTEVAESEPEGNQDRTRA